MRIYFENYSYNTDQIEPYLDAKLLYKDLKNNKRKTDRIGYLFVTKEKYSGPIFILPNSFLIAVDNKGEVFNVLGIPNVTPESVIDTDDPENPFYGTAKETFLPELSLWLYRSLSRFRFENMGTTICDNAELYSELPEEGARDKDFLSTSLELIDFLKEHKNLFTQITLINHSGRNKIDWGKTVQQDPFFENGEPWYLEPAIKQKSIDIDDTLLRLYYSVLKYLRDKYKFPVNLDDVQYELFSVDQIQSFIDTGVGAKKLSNIRHKYFRDELVQLWSLLRAFFAFNIDDKDKAKREECLLVRKYNIVFEAMVDKLISTPKGVEDLKKKQEDGKLIDHIFRFKSLLSKKSDIYYIGDSKYYRDDNKPSGVALYKQFTYAKNAIQYQIDNLYLAANGQKKKGNLRYRDDLTESYNITPNFFIRSRITAKDVDFNKPAVSLTYWDPKNNIQYPPTNKHFEDRLFDRDTLILREFSINLLFVIAAYSGYEDEYWTSEIHQTIRKDFIDSIDNEYEFFILTPQDLTPVAFYHLHFQWLRGKVFMLNESDDFFILGFEKTAQGKADKEALLNSRLHSLDTGKLVAYELQPTTLAELSR